MATKKFTFSNTDMKDFLENRIMDESELSHKSPTKIIEMNLLCQMLPMNGEARDIISNYLYSSDGSIKDALHQLFVDNAYFEESEFAQYDNFQPLVFFCLRNVHKKDVRITNVDEFNELVKWALAELKHYKENTKKTHIPDYDHLVLKKDNPITRVEWHYEFIHDAWSILDYKENTYKYLAMLIEYSEFTENAEKRNTVYNIIKTLSEEWN